MNYKDLAMNEITQKTENINISAPNAIGELYEILETIKFFEDIIIDDIIIMFESRSIIGSVIVGLWSFDFLKKPTFIDEYLIGYNNQRMNKNDQKKIIVGLLNVIRYCRIDAEEDEDAIDFHYAACGKLYRLAGKKTEKYFVDELKNKPVIQFIEALGVLVGFEYQGYLQIDTVNLLKKIANSELQDVRLLARKVIIDDINRVNKHAKFMDSPVSF